MNKGHLCWTQGNHTCKYMFIIIWFTFTQVKKDALGEKKMLITAVSKSPSQGSKKRS